VLVVHEQGVAMASEVDGAVDKRAAGLVAAIHELPTLPTVASRVVALANDPRSSAPDLCEVIKSDPSLTARILRVVNSPYYGVQHRIDTVAQATVMLGTRDLVSLVLGSSALRVLEAGARNVPDLAAFWLHSVTCAVASKEIGAQFRYRVPGTAFVAGLLHDAGKLILARRFPDEWRALGARSADGAAAWEEAEMALFGLDHAHVGAALAEHWNLPAALIEAVAYHHDPGRASNEQALLVAVVHLADALAHRLKAVEGESQRPLHPAALARLRQARVDFEASYVEKLRHDITAAMTHSAQLIQALGVDAHAGEP
jgi:putative nucleotidyltransferase with HDIG domain